MTTTAPETNRQETQARTETRELSDFERLLDRDFKMKVEYVPFMGIEKVTLSPQIVIRYFCKPTKEGKICSEEFAVRFVKLCQARGLDPWQGDAFLVGFDAKDGPEFNLITAHQAFLKRAEAHDKYEGMESGVTVYHKETDSLKDIEGDYVPADCILVAGWARVHRSDRKIQTYRRLDLNAFNKNRSVWLSNKEGMIVKCAEADALRSAFPNSLAGMFIAEELREENESKAASGSASSTGGGTKSDKPEMTSAERLAEKLAGKPKQSGGRPGPKSDPTTPAPTEEKKPDADPADEANKLAADEFVYNLESLEDAKDFLAKVPPVILARAKEIADTNLDTKAPDAEWKAVAYNAKYLMLSEPAPKASEEDLMRDTAHKFVEVAAGKTKGVEKELQKFPPSILESAKAILKFEGSVTGRPIDELKPLLYEAKMLELSARKQ